MEETPKCTFEEFYKEAFSEENRRNGNSKVSRIKKNIKTIKY